MGSTLGRPLLIEYEREDDPPDVVRYHEWGPDAILETEPDGSVSIRSGRRAWAEYPGGKRWLINPEVDMARLPPRDSKGRFVKRSKRKRRRNRGGTPKGLKRDSKGRFRAANPPLSDRVMRTAGDTLRVLGGEAVTRTVTRQLPRIGVDISGNRGPLLEAMVAVAVVAAAATWLGDDEASAVGAGALSAPIRDLVASTGVPLLSGALSPGLGTYVPRRSLASYVPGGGARQPALTSGAASGVRGYVGAHNGRRTSVVA